jgi:catechol 2,3-dioxygenase-like lactoylglutathione lyase family enzyme
MPSHPHYTYGLTHIALQVTDLDRTCKFYQDVFDMKIMYREEAFAQLTTPGSNDILVFEKSESVSAHSGIKHFGFRAPRPGDVEIARHRILAAGATILDEGEFVEGSPFIFFSDPDGYTIEIWYEKLPADAENFLIS